MLPEEKLETFIVALLFLSRLEARESCTLKNLHFFQFSFMNLYIPSSHRNHSERLSKDYFCLI